jgi:hypothetical protein
MGFPMSFSAFLYPILIEGAALLSKCAAGEFAKGAGKTAFEALTKQLTNKHNVQSLALLGQVQDNPKYATVIQADLDAPALARDPELLVLGNRVLDAIAALPATAQPAIDVGAIRALGNQSFKNIEGIRAEVIEADGDQTFEGIISPGKRWGAGGLKVKPFSSMIGIAIAGRDIKFVRTGVGAIGIAVIVGLAVLVIIISRPNPTYELNITRAIA